MRFDPKVPLPAYLDSQFPEKFFASFFVVERVFVVQRKRWRCFVSPTLNVLLFLLQLRRRKGVSGQPGIGNLLDNAEQDGDNYDGLKGLPEHDEENWNGEHVRHGCWEGVARRNDEDQEGKVEGGVGKKTRTREGNCHSWRNDGKPESVVIR